MGTNKLKGFTLLEVILCLCIISTALLVIINSFSKAIDMEKAINDYSLAMGLAENKLFDLENSGLTEVPEKGVFAEPYERFSWNINTERTDFDSLMKVDLKIIWDHRGVDKNIRLTTVLEG